MARKLESDAMRRRLTELGADQLRVVPDEVDWGDAGTLAHPAPLLRQVKDSAFREGEHAA